MSKIEVDEVRGNNGNMWWRVERLNGKPHGVNKGWYKNGQVGWKSNWRNSERYGLGEWWREDGDLSERKFNMI